MITNFNFNIISFVFIIILLLSDYLHGQNEIGKACTINNSNQAGVCKSVQHCPHALASIALRKTDFQICGFQNTLLLVCCASLAPIPPTLISIVFPNQNVPTTKPTTSTTMKIIQESPINKEKNLTMKSECRTATALDVGDKSRAKCLEYKDYVFSYPVAGGIPVDECKVNLTNVPLIIGGEDAKTKEFPHMALIGFQIDDNTKPLWLCGGSLISERFVLTAAHCLIDSTYKEAKYVRVGDLVLDTDTDDSAPQDFNVAERIQHPRYKTPSKYNDIGLIKLDKDVIFNSYIRPACLDTQPDIDDAMMPIATGWGQTSFQGYGSKTLQRVTLEYFAENECNTSYSDIKRYKLKYGIKYESQICAGSHVDVKDACLGDSGGPLQVVSREVYCMYNLIGITAFGKGCGVANIPGVYTRVYHYIEWIESIVWP